MNKFYTDTTPRKDFGTAKCPYCNQNFTKRSPIQKICGSPECKRKRKNEYYKKYYTENKEQYYITRQKYYTKHHKEILERQRPISVRYMNEHKEQYKAYQQANLAKWRKINKAYYHRKKNKNT